MLPYEQSPIDVNKVLAYMAVDVAKDILAAISDKLKGGEGEPAEMVVSGTIEIGRLKPWKRFERSILVVLKVYPGLVELLQDDKLRDELLLHDTGAGLLFASPAIKGYLPAARISQISHVCRDVDSAIEVLKRGFLYSSYGGSLTSLFETLKPHLEQDFVELAKFRFEHLEERARRAGIKEFVHIQIPIVEYEWRLRKIFHEIAIICLDCVELTTKLIGKLPSDRLMHHRDRILQTALAASSSINTLKVLCDKYALDESYRLTEALNSLRNLEKRV